mgnify:CR=1 FL=1
MLLFVFILTACNEQNNYAVTVGPKENDSDHISSTDSGGQSSEDTAVQEPSAETDSGAPGDEIEETDSGQPATDAPPDAKPDFVLQDINPSSQTFSQSVSPRDYLTQVSGWYFIQST